MTVATQTNPVQATGNGVTRTWSYSPIVIYASTELEVITTIIATGVETVRTLGTGSTNFSNNLTSFPGTGSIQFPAAGGTLLPSTERINIRRVVTLEQQTDLVNQGPYEPERLEDQFDKIVFMAIQLQEQLNRSLHIQRSELTTADSELPSLIGNESKVMRVNSDGDGFDLVDFSSSAGALSSAAGQQIVTGTASSGTSADIARADHTHQTPDIVLVTTFVFNAQNFI